MPSSEALRSRFTPATPQNYEELGIAQSLVLDLVLRRLLMEGFSTLESLANHLRVSVPIIDPEVEGGVDEHGAYIRLAVELGKGSYATTVLAEVMKAPEQESSSEPSL